MRSQKTALCVRDAESAVFSVAHKKSENQWCGRHQMYRRVIAGTFGLVVVVTVAVMNQSSKTSLVSRNALIDRIELAHLLKSEAGRKLQENAPMPYTELALIPASHSDVHKALEPSSRSQDVSDVLKNDFNSNLRLLTAAGGLDMKKVPQLDGSSQVQIHL
jgi:hypothetical protein